MEAFVSGSSSNPGSPTSFSHSNGRKTSVVDPYGDNSPGSSGSNAAPDKTKKDEERTRSRKGERIWPWKEGTCRRVASDAWNKMKAIFHAVAAPLSGKTKGNVDEEEVELDVLRGETRHFNGRPHNTTTSAPRSRLPVERETTGNQTWSQRYQARFRPRRDEPAPKDPYDNGFLSAPSSTPCSTSNGTTASRNNASSEGQPIKKTPSPGTWFSGLL
ncbi:hypothetical protein F4774DRAFT_411633 [Daldinia eschscholtzii]|nr:hypothetical protein F4774DRAFT_411633 [Daldinia eschscholtzii]